MLTCNRVIVEQETFSLEADWHIPTGRRVAIIGPSGAGKSTLINAICGFIDVQQGQVVLNDTDVTHTPPGERDIAMLFQDGNLFPALTLVQNVALGLRPTLSHSASELAKISAVLDRVGLSGLGSRKPAQLSGGQQGRAALARVLLQNKPFLILDEPFAALGPALRQEMLSLVREVLDETKATFLMVTHDPEDARRIAEDIIFVNDGTAHAPVNATELLSNPHPDLQMYLGG